MSTSPTSNLKNKFTKGLFEDAEKYAQAEEKVEEKSPAETPAPAPVVEEAAMNLMLSGRKRTGRGYSKSVYLDKENYEYIESKCKETDAKFSEVLNLMLRLFIESQN